jgi:hypothetical protein
LRAICVGGGLDTAASNEPIAKLLQRRLRETDFSILSTEEGLQCLLRLLSSRENGALPGAPLLKRGTRLELAVIDDKSRQMIRKQVQTLLKNSYNQ